MWAVAVAPGALKDEEDGGLFPTQVSGLAIRRLRAHWPRGGRCARMGLAARFSQVGDFMYLYFWQG